MTVRARSSGIAGVVEVPRRCRRTHAATSSAVGGSGWRWRSWRRTDPMSIDTACRSPRRAPAPARSTRRRCRRRAPARAASGPARRSRRRRPARPPRRRTAPPARCPGDGVRPRRRRRRCSRRGSPRSRRSGPARAGRRGRGASRRTRRSPRRCAPAPRRPARPVRSTPWPRRTTRESRSATSSWPSSRTVPMRSLIELVPQSMAATVASGLLIPSLCRRRLDARTRRPPVAEQVEDLVAERVDPAAHGERLAGEDVEALDPVGHAAGADALDLGDARARPAAPARRGARGSARAPRGRPPRARRRCRAAPASPSSRWVPSRVPMREAARGQVR